MSKHSISVWLRANRSSTRLAFLLQMGARIGAGFVGLIWTRLLVAAMGKALFASFLAFQKVITLGGLGDLGMGGVVGIRTSQLLAQEQTGELRKFLATARSAFVLLAVGAGAFMILLSPWMATLLHFKVVPGSGSLPLLFCVGGLLIGGVVISSYLTNLNYACGNVAWPVIPAFVLTQVAVCGHWLVARQHLPLWEQCLPYFATAVITLFLVNWYIRVSHPLLAGWRPMQADWRLIGSLLEGSFWVYLCSLGNAVYRGTDALVINAGSRFPGGTLTGYDANYRACDVTVSLAITAGFVAMPKIARWMASPDAKDRQRARVETQRLNQFEVLLGFVAALGYLAGNSLFVSVWWFGNHDGIGPAPLLLQTAFALNMAITTSGDAALQAAIRADHRGLRLSGILVGMTALVNVGLSLVAMRAGSLAGIALATVVAQSLQNLLSSVYACRRLELAWMPWNLRTWMLPVTGVLLAAWLRSALPFDSVAHVVLLIAAYAGIILAVAAILGINVKFIRDEITILRSFAKR
jgi:O-antigen/teichoic acid export membrane protein